MSRMLRRSHSTPTLGRLQRGSEPMKGGVLASDKLSVVVRVDVDGARIQIAATGHVTTSSLQALYPIVQRTSSLGRGLGVEVDLSQALVEPDALKQLQGYAKIHELPIRVDSARADRNVTVMPARDAPFLTYSMAGRAA